MAAGDLTRDTGMPVSIGNKMLLTGTVELDDTFRAFALLPTTSYIESCQMVCEDGVGTPDVNTNVNASDTATNGTIKARGNDPTVRTYRYQLVYSGF